VSKRKQRFGMVLIVIVFITLNYIKLPYYLNLPGGAYELEPIVEVEGGDKASGSFMMTTVGVSKSEVNIFTYLWAHLAPYHVLIPSEDMRRTGESDKEYVYRQLHLMDSSQNAAITVAYEKANKQITYINNGVYVMKVIKGMDAEHKLLIGDRIFKVEGETLEDSNQFVERIGGLTKGDSVLITIERDEVVMDKEIFLRPFPNEPEKYGVGISLVTDQQLDVEPDIRIDANKVGGPSAGLMFTLEIYNQLTEGDLTKGMKIAGTGTINKDGTVGPIGGISQKIVAADKAGAKYFLAPNENSKPNSNYELAVKTVEEIKSNMKVIPINNFDEALNFLKSL
jgi:Lon-like protease